MMQDLEENLFFSDFLMERKGGRGIFPLQANFFEFQGNDEKSDLILRAVML